jgi:hypothetical protein
LKQNVTPPHASSVINLSANDDSYYWDFRENDRLRNRTRSYFTEESSPGRVTNNHERMRILTTPNRFDDDENDFGNRRNNFLQRSHIDERIGKRPIGLGPLESSPIRIDTQHHQYRPIPRE